MTDETQEPGSGEGEPQNLPISEEAAQRFIGSLSEEEKEGAKDEELNKLVIGNTMALQEETRGINEIWEGMKQGKPSFGIIHMQEEKIGKKFSPEQIEKSLVRLKKAIEEQQETIDFYLDLAKGVPLVEAIRKNANNAAWFTHQGRNKGLMLRLHHEQPLEGLEDCLGSVAGGVEYFFRQRQEEASASKKEQEFISAAKQKVLERARKLDEELGQK